MSENAELADDARALILEGAEKWIDHWGGDVAGCIVTGWLLVIEATDTSGGSTVTWAAGNGMPTSTAQGGLSRHKVAGLAHTVIREIAALDVRRSVAGLLGKPDD